jgi:DNA ligase (NAD+)
MAPTPMTLSEMKKLYVKAQTAYYNGNEPIMSDKAFDKLEDTIRKVSPEWDRLKKTGVKVADKKTDTLLWRPMPSLNKMYDEAVPKFYAKHKAVKKWVWSDKLDGTSLQLIYENGKASRLITRGDGITGGDISFFIPHLTKLKLIPATISTKEQTVFRLEGLMKKKVFEKNWSREAKGDAGADNGRNLVNGLFNRKDMHPALIDVDLVVLGVYGSTLPEGLKLARKWGFKVVTHYLVASSELPDINHANELAEIRDDSEYEMDGLVIAPADWVMHYEDAEKPKQLIAYKFNDEANAAECKVKRVIYQTSGFGRVVPKIEIEPTKMDGVLVKFCTVHNAKWMLDRGIGPGAILKIVRSGGVIPKVVGVVKKGKIQLPEVPHKLVGVNFMAIESSPEQRVRIIDRFLTTLGIEFIARKTIGKLHDVKGGLKHPHDYIKLVQGKDATAIAVLENAGLGPNQSEKVLTELTRVLCNEISLKQLMVASSCFDVGVGERRLSAVEAVGISMNELCGYSSELSFKEIKTKLLATKGFADNTVNLILEGVENFKSWFADVTKYLTVNGDLPKPKKAKKVLNSKLAGVVATFTGYRDQAQLSMIEALGGTVADFSTKTTVLLYREGGRKSSKIEKAGDKAMTFTEFCKKYGVK